MVELHILLRYRYYKKTHKNRETIINYCWPCLLINWDIYIYETLFMAHLWAVNRM